MRFAGEFVDDALGADRLRGAYAEAGLAAGDPGAGTGGRRHPVRPHPHRTATVLIGDFGGGTSDFSVMRFDPRARHVTPLGHAGIGIAGDVFDYRIIDRAIAPLLGKGDTYRIMGKPLPVPPEYYSGFARWHLLSLMRTPRTLRAIAEVARTAQHPERLRHLIALIEDGLGYALYQAVSDRQGGAVAAPRPPCCASATRTSSSNARSPAPSSKSWIAPDLARLAATVDQVLAQAERAGGPGGPRVPHRRHRLRSCRAPPVRNPLRRGAGWPAAASSSRWPRALR